MAQEVPRDPEYFQLWGEPVGDAALSAQAVKRVLTRRLAWRFALLVDGEAIRPFPAVVGEHGDRHAAVLHHAARVVKQRRPVQVDLEGVNEQSPLPRKVREFVMIAVCLSINSAENVVLGHMRRAVEHGATPEELLAVVECTVASHAAKPLAAGTRGGKKPVHPNDDVNRSQSSNDTFPTALHMAVATALIEDLLPSVRALRDALDAKRAEFDGDAIVVTPVAEGIENLQIEYGIDANNDGPDCTSGTNQCYGLDDAQLTIGADQTGTIDRKAHRKLLDRDIVDDLIECVICRLPSYVYHCLFIQPQSIARRNSSGSCNG